MEMTADRDENSAMDVWLDYSTDEPIEEDYVRNVHSLSVKFPCMICFVKMFLRLFLCFVLLEVCVER